MKTLIKNAKTIEGKTIDILIENGQIIRMAYNQKADAQVIIDACGKYVLSGSVNAYFDGDIEDAQKLLSQGVTTVFDFANDDSVTEHLVDSGIKVFKAVGDFNGNTILDKNLLDSEVNKNKELGVLQPIIFVKSPNESEEDNYNTIVDYARKNNYIVATCASENLENVGEIDKEHGLSPIGLLESYGFLDRKCILIDCVYADKEDVEKLRNYDVSICTRPTNNLSDGYGIAPIYSFFKNDINVVVGGVSSNHFKEIKLVADLQAGVLNEKNIIDFIELKDMYCNNATHIFSEIGGIEEGLSADIVLVDDNNIAELTPLNVKLVMINGNIVYEK